jgi:sporulation protein YlmC with PRC-barrel domain
MPHYGLLHDHKLENVDDLRGAEVYGVNDEKLGTIDDVIFDHSNGEIRYILLKTGGMLSGKRIMVPANRVEPYGHHDDKFYAELDKERLEMLPEFNNDTLKNEGDWAKFEKNYEERWNDGTVMYNKDTGRIITPPADEQAQPAGGQPLSQQARESLNRDFTPQRMGKRDELWGVGDSGTGKTTLRPQKASIAGREDAILQNQTRQNESRQNAGQQNIGERRVGQQAPSHTETGRREDASRENPNPLPQQTTREVEGVMSTEYQVSSSPESSNKEAMREPGVYKVDRVPGQSGQSTTARRDVSESPNQALNANYGRRWMQFQQHLREHRDKVVSGCNLCGTQDKAA